MYKTFQLLDTLFTTGRFIERGIEGHYSTPATERLVPINTHIFTTNYNRPVHWEICEGHYSTAATERLVAINTHIFSTHYRTTIDTCCNSPVIPWSMCVTPKYMFIYKYGSEPPQEPGLLRYHKCSNDTSHSTIPREHLGETLRSFGFA